MQKECLDKKAKRIMRCHCGYHSRFPVMLLGWGATVLLILVATPAHGQRALVDLGKRFFSRGGSTKGEQISGIGNDNGDDADKK